MIAYLANRIADFIYLNSNLPQDERDVYVYGYEIIISSAITFVLLITTGLVFDRLIESIVFFELCALIGFDRRSISICISLAMASTAIAMIITHERRESA